MSMIAAPRSSISVGVRVEGIGTLWRALNAVAMTAAGPTLFFVLAMILLSLGVVKEGELIPPPSKIGLQSFVEDVVRLILQG